MSLEDHAGTIVEAANLLGITRHALKRRIIKHNIEWPKPRYGPNAVTTPRAQATQASQLAPDRKPGEPRSAD